MPEKKNDLTGQKQRFISIFILNAYSSNYLNSTRAYQEPVLHTRLIKPTKKFNI
jgi:hypothetical protein